jgi:prepilin peptidase dependent protein B
MLHPQQGLTLIELMVGMAIGLVITAIALAALSLHLRENHQLLTEARLMQELRTVTGLMSRELRRAGELTATAEGVRFVLAGGSDEQAYRLRDGVIDMKIGDGHWQAMTDAGTLRVSALRIVPRTQEIVLAGFCSRPCEDGHTQCPPRQVLRSVDLEVQARATHDARWTRTTARTVQLRHDTLIGACPA